MDSSKAQNWLEANRRYLQAEIAKVRAAIENYIDSRSNKPGKVTASEAPNEPEGSPSALQTVSQIFGLSEFEKQTLLLCAGMEMDAEFASLCARAHADSTRPYPTFSLALSALAEPHWSALAPSAPLRFWRLLEVGAGSALTLCPLRIDERILNYMIGVQHIDARLADYAELATFHEAPVASHCELVSQVASTLAQIQDQQTLPVVQLTGGLKTGKRTVAKLACERFGLTLHILSVHSLPGEQTEMAALIRLLQRESYLSATAFLIDCDEMERTEERKLHAVNKIVQSLAGVVFVAGREAMSLGGRPTVAFEVRKPTVDEQRSLWREKIAGLSHSSNGYLDSVVTQFSLAAETIASVSADVNGRAESVRSGREGQPKTEELLWDACRRHCRPRLDDLARFIEPVATWDDLVLPKQEKQILHEIAVHLRHRIKVYHDWGFAEKGARGLGISALFAGASGTGKTMAAEVLANEFRLDLYRIDLSGVVSKYIGETEKNLRRIFDAAEESGVILLFDEADALFGKRSEVKDSHDRYANIEVSYLLQRMEAYRGLAILTTNRKSALDTAFLRRIRFIVNFPFPDASDRAEIWRRIFPAATPRARLDETKLARLNIAGGNIRNIAMNAAFLAAGSDEPVQMKHLLRAARSEYAKIEKSLTESEIRGWV